MFGERKGIQSGRVTEAQARLLRRHRHEVTSHHRHYTRAITSTIKIFKHNFSYHQRITLTNKLKQCSLIMNKIAYIALNKTLKYNLTVTFFH